MTLGLHVVDVSHYIEKDSYFDAQASQRACSIRIPNKPIRMFPECINQQACSLEVGKDRLAFSIYIKITAQGTVQLESSRISKTAVRCIHLP